MLRMVTVIGCLLLLASFGAPSLLAENRVLSLDGHGDYVYVDYSPSLSFTENLTAEAWIKTIDNHGGAVTQHNGGFDGNWALGVDNGNLEFCCTSHDQPQSEPVNDGVWHHIAGVYDDTNDCVKHYIDGVQVLSVEDTRSLPINAISVLIGDENNHLYAFAGLIDEVRLWNIARTQQEIRGSMCHPIENPELLENLVGYWNFDDGTADDLSQYSNDGTLQGDAAIVDGPDPFICWPSAYNQVLRFSGSEDALSMLRYYRDSRLMSNPQAATLVTDLYDNCADDLAAVLLRRPRLALRCAALVKKHLPGLEKAVDGGTMAMTPLQLATASKLLNDIGKAGSAGLRAYMQRVQALLKDPKALASLGIKVSSRMMRRAPGAKDTLTATWGAIKGSVE